MQFIQGALPVVTYFLLCHFVLAFNVVLYALLIIQDDGMQSQQDKCVYWFIVIVPTVSISMLVVLQSFIRR